ncbi:HNH endonuclease [Hamadaea tsunoensis]|uniref:HNH endonuclease n=1 Tax=Hamadaea tsunoensis TaxID=53368 RepID=UPI000685F725|nr:HNH endonuclease [Hamadaea tsunoensis]
MPSKRPAIPADVQLAVRAEAGYACAVPGCRQTPIEIAHIMPWAVSQDHSYANLVALCPTCHTRFDGGEISVDAMRLYKAKVGADGRIVVGLALKARIRARVKEIVDGADLEGLLAMGCPSNEYDPEVDDLVELLISGEINLSSVGALWRRWFGRKSFELDVQLASLARDLKDAWPLPAERAQTLA